MLETRSLLEEKLEHQLLSHTASMHQISFITTGDFVLKQEKLDNEIIKILGVNGGASDVHWSY